MRRGFYNNGTVKFVQRNSSSSSRRPNMSQDVIKKLPCFDYKLEEKKGTNIGPVECAVCLENFKVGDMYRLLPNCNHTFHLHCIDLWLAKIAVCPTCRTDANSPKIGGPKAATQ